MVHPVFETFSRAIQAHGLLSPSERVLAAVSGGGDSVALLRLLVRYSEHVPISIIVAHVNHRLRGSAADQDQCFVDSLAHRLELECVILAPEEEGRPLRNRGEEAARRVRHALLVREALRSGCARIALGHTMDDQAETLLMRLVRGAGRRGISAMAVAGPGRLIRPMLGIRRQDARAYLEEIGQEFREDETNADQRFLRNRIRARVLPLLEELNPKIVRTLARTAELVEVEDRYLDQAARDWVERHARPVRRAEVAVAAKALSGLPLPIARRAARVLLVQAGSDPRGVGLTAVEEILDLAGRGKDGDARALPGGLEAAREGLDLVLRGERASLGLAAGFSLTLPIPGVGVLPWLGAEIHARVVTREQVRDTPCGGDLVHLDAGALGPAVTVRSRLPGDTFHPLGAPGRRKLKEFLIDGKVPRTRRDLIPLVVGPSGIAWVVGLRIGHFYRLTPATRIVAVLEYRRVDLGSTGL